MAVNCLGVFRWPSRVCVYLGGSHVSVYLGGPHVSGCIQVVLTFLGVFRWSLRVWVYLGGPHRYPDKLPVVPVVSLQLYNFRFLLRFCVQILRDVAFQWWERAVNISQRRWRYLLSPSCHLLLDRYPAPICLRITTTITLWSIGLTIIDTRSYIRCGFRNVIPLFVKCREGKIHSHLKQGNMFCVSIAYSFEKRHNSKIHEFELFMLLNLAFRMLISGNKSIFLAFILPARFAAEINCYESYLLNWKFIFLLLISLLFSSYASLETNEWYGSW